MEGASGTTPLLGSSASASIASKIPLGTVDVSETILFENPRDCLGDSRRPDGMKKQEVVPNKPTENRHIDPQQDIHGIMIP